MVKTHEKIKMASLAIALMAVLSMTGTGWAKKSFAGPGLQGQFVNGGRTSVEVSLPVTIEECGTNPAQTLTYTVKAYIFQPSGRMFAIGISGTEGPLACTTTTVPVTVEAFSGLEFKPGPATLLYKVTIISDDNDPITPENPVVVDEAEYGSRIDLH